MHGRALPPAVLRSCPPSPGPAGAPRGRTGAPPLASLPTEHGARRGCPAPWGRLVPRGDAQAARSGVCVPGSRQRCRTEPDTGPLTSRKRWFHSVLRGGKTFFVKNTHLLTVFHLSVQNTKGPGNELSVRGCAGAQAAAALPDAPTLGTSPVRASAVPSHPEGRGPEAMPQAAACSSSHGNVSASLGSRDSCERITTGFPAPSSRRHVLAQL